VSAGRRVPNAQVVHRADGPSAADEYINLALARYYSAMATIQIREIPEEAYEVIRKRARASGRSIQSYMRDWVVDFASRSTTEEALAAMEAARAASNTPGATRESILADLAADRR
jgi:plasmid stability protein